MKFHAPTFPTEHTTTSEAFTPELLATATASSDATLDLIIPGGKRHFTSYYWVMTGLFPDTDAVADLDFRVTLDSGITFEEGVTDYEYAAVRFSNAAVQNNIAAGANAITPTDPGVFVGGAEGEGLSGKIWTHNLGSDTDLGWFWWDMTWIEDGGQVSTAQGAGHYDATSRPGVGVGLGQINGLRFLFTGATILRGEFALYGVM